MTTRNPWFLMLAGLLSAALVVGVACGGDDDDDTTGGNTPAAGTTTTVGGDIAPADQQKVTLQFPEPEFFDPHRSNFEQDIGVERMLFRGLYNLTDDGSGGVKVVPAMADGEPTVNGLVYTIKIGDHNWSDGEPLTADDFVYGLQRQCDPATASPYAYILGDGIGELAGCQALIDNTDAAQAPALIAAIGARAVDEKTLELTLTKNIPTLTTIYSLWPTFPSRRDLIAEFAEKWTEPANIVVNGPYTLAAYTPKDSLVLTPNPEWSGQKPAIQEITLKFIDDLSAAYKAFQTGELQMTNIQAIDVATARADSALEDTVVVVPSARITTVEVQMEDEALSDINLRMALSRSIDRETLVDVVYDGVHEPATYWVVKGLVGFQGNEAFDDLIGYDVDEAKKALQAYTDSGKTLPTLRFTTRDTQQRRDEYDFLAKAWKDTLGLETEGQFVDAKTRSEIFNSGEFQMFQGGWQLDYPDIENPLVGLFNTDGGNNKYNCSDPQIDALFETAANATSEEARIQAYEDIETRIITTLCGVIPMFQDAQPFLVATKIGGVVPNGTIDAGLPGNYCVECWFVKK